MKFEETLLSRQPVFDGRLIQVEVQQVKTPNGRQARREVVHHAPAVALLMIDEADRVILMKQWRAPIQKLTYEIPAGKVDARGRSPPGRDPGNE